MPEPIAERPALPRGYGVPATSTGLLDWAHVDRRLRDATVYWLATTRPDGRPRVRPLDGLWHDGFLYVGGSPETGWARDLARRTDVAVHLDDGTDVVILEGEAELLEHGVDDELAVTLAALSNAKYPQYGMTPEMYKGPGPYAIRPRRAFAWRAFPGDVTRFRFDAA
jgi:nitroimidazol reductase NimA-like FMN-containing flavoprotein (pyridoxamine 5'-phosphate oxidase superfamily)